MNGSPRLLEALADRVLGAPRSVLVALLLAGAAGASMVPRLEADFSPEDLAGPADAATGTDPIVVLVEAKDGPALAGAPLRYAHGLAGDVAALDGVASVVSLTRAPLPHVVEEAPTDGLTLDDLAADPVDEGPTEVERSAVVGALVATDAERWPGGLSDWMATRGVGRFEVSPLVEGDALGEGDVARVEAALETLPGLEGRLVGRRGRVLPIVATPAEGIPRERLAALVTEVRAAVAARPPPSGVEVQLAGLPVLRASMIETMERDRLWLVVVSLLANAGVLVLAARWLAGSVLPLGVVGTTLGIVLGGMALAGLRLDLLTNVVPPLLVTLSLGDAVHFTERYREEAARPGDAPGEAGRAAALRRAFVAMAVACLLTSVTTAVGFGSLAAARAEPLRRFGLVTAAGVLVAYLVTMTFLPASLRLARGHPPRPPTRGGAVLARIAARAARRAGWVAAGFAALGVVAAVGAASVRPDGGLLDQFDPDDPNHRATRLVEASLEGVRRVEVELAADDGVLGTAAGLRALDDFARWAEARSGVLAVSGPHRTLSDAWVTFTGDRAAGDAALASEARVAALRELVALGGTDPLRGALAPDGGEARLTVHVADAGVAEMAGLLAAVDARLDPLRGRGVRVTLGGEAVHATAGLGLVVGDLLSSLGVAILLIFGVLGLLFRSLRLALLSVPPNLLPLLVVLGYMGVRGIPLGPATVIVFAVSLGLAVDGTIHLVCRLQEEARARRVAGALVRAVRGTGRAIVLGAGTLLVGFGALTTSAFVPVRLFGELSLVAIGTALVAELVLVPALFALVAPGLRRAA